MNGHDDDDRTVFGQQLPPTIGRAKPEPVMPQGDDSTIFGAKFPSTQINAAYQPSVQTAQGAEMSRVSFQDALRGSGMYIGAGSNPVLAAAADVVTLFGRLRTGRIDIHAAPLRDYILREIDAFTQKAQAKGVSQGDIETARYALVATADDIVMTIPGCDPAYLQQYSLAAEMLKDRSAGIGFFARLDVAFAAPERCKYVLELMLICLHLGFEGKYRTAPNGPALLVRLRNEVYLRLRSVENRPAPQLSRIWKPVILQGKRAPHAMPLWFFGAVGGGMIVALFAMLSWILSSDSQAAQAAILQLNDPNARVLIEGESFEVYTPVFVDTQLERLEKLLAPEIKSGAVMIASKGDYIMIRVGDALQFGSGAADLASDVSDLAGRIGQALDQEPGNIVVEGHSDNVPLSGAGRYKSNDDLSKARAETVRLVLVPFFADPSRLSVIGVGSNDPLDTSGTADANARNRRVEILIQQERKL